MFPTEAVKPPGEVLPSRKELSWSLSPLLPVWTGNGQTYVRVPEKVSFKTGSLETDQDLNSTIETRGDDNNKDTWKKVKKMKKRMKESDKMVKKGKSRDTHDKKGKRKRKPEENNKSNLNAKKNENQRRWHWSEQHKLTSN